MDIAAIIFKELREYCRVSKNDILVGLGFKESEFVDNEAYYQSIFEFQQTFFKYRKPQHPLKKNVFKTDQELKATLKRIKDNNDPTIMFNRLRRLPYYPSYSFELTYKNQYKNVTQNILVFYNFSKTIIIALFLVFLYFLYTVFFFKLQFLKQMSI